MGIRIIEGALSADHVHLFVEIPPKHSISDVMRRIKGCTSRKLQQEFPELRNRYWGRRFWARGYFSTTPGNVTNEVIRNYIAAHCEDKPTDDIGSGLVFEGADVIKKRFSETLIIRILQE